MKKDVLMMKITAAHKNLDKFKEDGGHYPTEGTIIRKKEYYLPKTQHNKIRNSWKLQHYWFSKFIRIIL